MKIIKRQMQPEQTTILTADHNQSEYLPNCQASFNSDGNITLRNYDRANKNSDEIIILSTEETDAIYRLFSKMSLKAKAYDLPF